MQPLVEISQCIFFILEICLHNLPLVAIAAILSYRYLDEGLTLVYRNFNLAASDSLPKRRWEAFGRPKPKHCPINYMCKGKIPHKSNSLHSETPTRTPVPIQSR